MQTRERVLGAAVAEFKRSGMDGADVGDIVTIAGVARGTFYFHFPTKEHVLVELVCREEARLSGEFVKFLDRPHDLTAAMSEVVRLVTALEGRVGQRLFKDLLALHFSPSHPGANEWVDHPLIVALVVEIERARAAGEVHVGVDAVYHAMFFLTGIYGVLSATYGIAARDELLRSLIASAARGLEAR
jgi:TetR/AcrR family transcriptional repressor of uid operon